MRALACTVLSCILPLEVFAVIATQNITASISFAAPPTISKLDDIFFGRFPEGQTGSVTIDADSTLSTTPNIPLLTGTPKAAELNIAGTLSQSVIIQTENYVADSGVLAKDATCKTAIHPEAACSGMTIAAAATSISLNVGATIDIDGTKTLGMSAAPNFDLVVLYN